MLVDIHCHLDDKQFDQDREEVIERAKAAGVKKIITAGTDLASNKRVLALAEQYDIVEPALGAYPLAVRAEEIDNIIEHIEKNKEKVVAISEVGLDFSYDEIPREEQEIVFRKMIQLAKKINKPIIIHSRKAEERVLEMLEEEQAKKVVLHCFCGRKALIKRGIENKYSFSIPANVGRTESFQGMVSMIPLQQLLTETDSPYLSPDKEARNEPANVAKSIQVIAKLKGITEEECANALFMNFQQLC